MSQNVCYVYLYANNVLIITIQQVFELTDRSILLYFCMICNSMCILDVSWGYNKQCNCIWYSVCIYAVKHLCTKLVTYDWMKARKCQRNFSQLKTEPQIKNFIQLKWKEKKEAAEFLLCKLWTNVFETNWEETRTSSNERKKRRN